MIDIGVNLTNTRFDSDRAEVLAQALSAGVCHCVITGTSLPESEQAIALCQQWNSEFPGLLSATAGIHPHEADHFTPESIPHLKALALEFPQTVVAIGETGLDFNRNFSSPANQEKAFEAQVELACNLGLPLFLHERDAFDRQHAILRTCRDQISDGVIHCFTGDRKSLFAYLDLDLYIGITGWVCDERRGQELQSLVASIPANRLLIETDAPYLLPRTLTPKPRNNRNEPAFLGEILRTLAALRGETVEWLAQQTTDNAQRFFRLRSLASSV